VRYLILLLDVSNCRILIKHLRSMNEETRKNKLNFKAASKITEE
jgi:hypothetical protein